MGRETSNFRLQGVFVGGSPLQNLEVLWVVYTPAPSVTCKSKPKLITDSNESQATFIIFALE